MLNIDKSYSSLRLAPLGIHYGLVHEARLKSDSESALRFATPLLNQGDASTQWYIGLMTQTGRGIKRDLAAARDWFRKSAAQGFCLAQDALVAIDSAERNEELKRDALRCPSM